MVNRFGKNILRVYCKLPKSESVFSVNVEDGVALLIFCCFFLYFYMSGYKFIDALIYSATTSGIAGAAVYLVRKMTEKKG